MDAPKTNLPIKLCYRDSVFRVSVDAKAVSLHSLSCLAASTFNVPLTAFTLKYTDPEGDFVNAMNDDDLKTALMLFQNPDNTYKTIRFTVIPSAGAVFKETVVEPVVKAMESLVQTLDAAKESMKNEEWVQRAQTNAHVRNEALKSAVADARESLQAVCECIQEIPFDQMVKDASTGIKSAAGSAVVMAKEVVEDVKKEKIVQDAAEGIKSAAGSAVVMAKEIVEDVKKEMIVQDAAEGIKSAAEGISKFAKDTVEDVKKDPTVQDVAVGIKTMAEGLGEVAKEAVGEIKSKVAPYFAQDGVNSASVAPVPADAAVDNEWEQVAEQQTAAAAAAAAAVEEEEEIVEVVVSEEEKKWADQLATIREIVPGADTTRAIAQLEQANGNIEIVLNALMEEM